MKSKPVSVNVTANGLAANQAQQTANQAVTSANKYKMAWEEANSEVIEALDTAQKEFESNLAWAKSQIYEGQHQNDSAVASLRSDMESSWNSMSTVEESLYNSANTATSEVDSRLESLRTQNSLSLADLRNAADSLHGVANSLNSNMDSVRGSLAAATSELGQDITSTKNSLDWARDSLTAVDSSLQTATSEVGNSLNSVKNSLTAVDADLRSGITKANNDLATAANSLTATGNSLANRAGSLATETSELQRQTGQLSGSMSTANSMIMFNSNAIAEVKRTAGEISTTVSNIRIGGRNLLTNTRTLSDVWQGETETVDGFTAAKATQTQSNTVSYGYYDPLRWPNLTVKPNTDYVMTFYAKASKQTTINSFLFNIGTGDTVSTGYNDGATPNTLTTDYQRFIVKFHTDAIPAGRAITCLPVRLKEVGVTAWIYGVQLEEGNTATQWTPNPSDTDQAISKVSQTADAIRADLTNTQGDVASVQATASSLQTQITDNKNNISSVKQTADSLTTRMSNAEGNVSSLQQTAKGLESTVGQMPAKWQQAINDKTNAQVLSNGVDMNNLTTAGTYLIKDFNVKNAPISAWFMATVEATADKSRVVQRVKKDDANVAYERSNSSTGWTSWERVATGSDITEVKQTVNSITTRVGSAEGNISQLQQTATTLQSTISDHTGKLSQLQQDADKITTTVRSGGVNLLSNSKGKFQPAKSVIDNWQGFGNTTVYLEQGQKYTLSAQCGPEGFYFSGTHDTSKESQRILLWLVSSSRGINQVVSSDTTDISQGGTHFTWNYPSDTYILRVNSYDIQNRGYAYNVQVECGETATPWKPKSDDIDQAISKVSQTADSIRTDLVNTKGDVASVQATANSLTSDVANAKGDISQLQQTTSGLTSRVGSAEGNISSVTQTANAVKTDLENTKGEVASIKVKADSLTTQLADANGNISALQQTATGLQTTVQSQSGQISQLQQDTKGLTATVTDGGQNLILNSGNPSTLEHWRWTGEVTLRKHPFWKNGTENLFVLSNTSSTDQKFFASERFVIEPNQDYTLSFYAFNNSALTNADVYYLPRKSGSSNNWDAAIKLANSVKFSASNAQYIRLTFNSGNYNEGYIRFDNNSSTTEGTSADLYLTDIQLEKGKIATAWSNSPGDIAQLKLTADGLTSKVADTQGNVSKLQLTASTLQTQIADNQKNISDVKITADTVQTDLTNAKEDIARVKVTADSLTSSMTNAQDQIGVLQHRADSLTSTLSNGGTNLLNNSNTFGWGISAWNGNPPHSLIDDENGLKDCKIVLATGVQNQGFWWPGNNTLNQTYTLSFDAKSDNGVAKLANVGLENNFLMSNPPTISKDWIRYSVSGKVTRAGQNWTIYFSAPTADNIYVRRVQLEYGDTATPWKPSSGDISSLQQTASQLTVDMKDAKGNISSLQDTASQFSTRLHDAEGNVSSLQETSKELDTQIKAVDGRATTIKETADGISARVSKIEGSNVVGSLLKLDGSEAGLGTYVNNKLIAGINTNPDGVTIDGKNIHLNGQTHIDDGVINASKITVYNTVGDNKGNQYLAVAWGQLNSTIGGKDDQGNTLWGSINQTNSKLTSYYQELKNDGSSTRSLIQQKSDQILLAVDQKVQYSTYTISESKTWDFNLTKSIYGNWFLNGDTSGKYFYNGPPGLAPWVYVQSRGSADGTRFVTTVWRDYDPTQYQRTWTGDHWTPWVMLPNSSNLVSAINLSPDGVTISGKHIELDGDTTVTGQLNLLPKDQRSVSQFNQGLYNPWSWYDSKVFASTGGIQLQSTISGQQYSNDNTSVGGLVNNSSAAITTLAPTYLKFTLYKSWGDFNNNYSNQLCRTYIDAGRIETNDVWAGDIRLIGSKMRGLKGSLYVTNSQGTNFDNGGAAGFQVLNGIGLGASTIYTPNTDLYVQKGNVDSALVLGQSYSGANKTSIHCQNVISQVANTVASRLSVKTAITKVDYDRALMAVQNTDMYDYRYTADDSGQHYVSGIIDDIHDNPEYNMDPMLINQERTARIDANLLGYHHVVLQEILKRLDKLEAK